MPTLWEEVYKMYSFDEILVRLPTQTNLQFRQEPRVNPAKFLICTRWKPERSVNADGVIYLRRMHNSITLEKNHAGMFISFIAQSYMYQSKAGCMTMSMIS